MYKKGWTGINIDLNQTSIELFNIARNNEKNFNVAISNKSQKIKYYYRKKINMLNTINKQFAKSSFKKGFKIGYVQSETLNIILNKSKLKNKKIDFLNLDIEGNEINALKSLNFRKYSPKLICIEIHNNTSGRNSKDYIKKNRYISFLKIRVINIFGKMNFLLFLKENNGVFLHTPIRCFNTTYQQFKFYFAMSSRPRLHKFVRLSFHPP